MKDRYIKLDIKTNKTILSSESLFYKTENFIKQTKYVSNIDMLLTKFCETIILNITKILNSDEKNTETCFRIQTIDKNFTFLFKFGCQVDQNLNPNDIIFFDYQTIKFLQQINFKVDEYAKKTDLSVIIRVDKNSSNGQAFKKLYLISNISGVNLPRLNENQKEIVETVDKNILVQGVAGSGKTNICIDKIIFTACKNFSGKVLYTTFSRGLLVDTKLKVELYKKDLIQILNDYQSKSIIFLDDNHKKALENKLGIYFFSDDDDKIFEKIEKIINFLTNKVDYLLIEDIYRSKFGDAEFVNEHYFLNKYCKALSNHQIEKCFSKLSRYSNEIIYKEIYGMIFGYFNFENNNEILSLEDYIQKRQNSFSKQDCEMIYQIALDFKRHCQKNNLIDNNIASKKLIVAQSSDFEYSLSIIDEVQDYTQANLCLFKKLSLKLFCVGDALQMINPSYFNFGYLKSLLYEKDLTDVKELKSNYRNTAKIADIIDSLGEINKAEFGTHSFVLKGQSIDNGQKTTAVFVSDFDFIKQISSSGFEDFTFVCANQNQKKELKNIIKNQEVLTVSEIKGLERNTVVTFDILSSNKDKWNILMQNKVNRKQADENSVFRYYYNLFYVGVSRAKQNIFVFETSKIEQFEKFFYDNFDIKNSKEAIKILNEIVGKTEFSQQELIERVEEFVKQEQFENARFMANKIKDDLIRIDNLRTIEIYEDFIRSGKYREAGIKFWEYGMIEQAKKQFILSGDTILNELIDICTKNSNRDLNIDIINYFEDIKDNKIAQSFIIETVKKDIAKLKENFSNIKENLKKGRK